MLNFTRVGTPLHCVMIFKVCGFKILRNSKYARDSHWPPSDHQQSGLTFETVGRNGLHALCPDPPALKVVMLLFFLEKQSMAGKACR